MPLKKFLKLEYLLVLAIITLGFYLRFVNLEKTAFFDADQENFAWTAVRIMKERKPTLIGIKAGEFPVFIGPLMYYIYAFFLWIFKMDPAGLSYFHLLLSFLTLFSIYYILKKIFDVKTAAIGLFLYSLSGFFIEYDRRIWLPGPLILTSLWVFYALCRINKKNQKHYLLFLGILIALGFQLHITALFFIPIIIIGILFKRLSLRWSSIISGIGTAFLGFLPIVLFDLRHNFLNLKGWLTLLERTGEKINYWQRLEDLIRYNLENEARIFFPLIDKFNLKLAALFFLAWLSLLPVRKKEYQFLKLSFLWVLIPTLIFLPLKLHTPEYYFVISFPILLIFSVFILSKLFNKSVIFKGLIFILLTIYLKINVERMINQKTENEFFLPYKKQAIDYTIKNAQGKDFSVFYEMDRGYNYGYDYLFWWRLGKIPEKKENADFTIVVPWYYKDLKLSAKFGGIGVINAINN